MIFNDRVNKDACSPNYEQSANHTRHHLVRIAIKEENARYRQTAAYRRQAGPNPGRECPFGCQ